MNSVEEEHQKTHQEPQETPASSHNKEWESFISRLEAFKEPEAKLQEAINFMQASISREGTPHLKNFWDARTLCLPLFKENIPPALRSILWEQFDNLSKEARRLKEILDEQSAFAAEQIEGAIGAIETELDGLETRIQAAFPIPMPEDISIIQKNAAKYQALQKELNFLNVAAARINSMRKELIRTEMRIRQKNKFFQRLSLAGDRVFPRRKELIRQVSDLFVGDVEEFIRVHFTADHPDEAVFRLREEIKSLQTFAKDLTLNTQAFTRTRMKLSESWDKLKEFDKERKKERAAQKAAFRENVEAVLEKIKAFSQSFSEGILTVDQAYNELDGISQFMRTVQLGRDEVKFLKNEVAQARRPIEDKIRAAEQERQAHEQQKLQERKEKISVFRQSLESLMSGHDHLDAEQMTAKRKELQDEILNLRLTKLEKQEFEKHLKNVHDVINDKKQRALLNLSPDDQEAWKKLADMLDQCRNDRQEVKEVLEKYRKESGSSNLDFSQAMMVNGLIATERERLERINHTIRELEKKLTDFE